MINIFSSLEQITFWWSRPFELICWLYNYRGLTRVLNCDVRMTIRTWTMFHEADSVILLLSYYFNYWSHFIDESRKRTLINVGWVSTDEYGWVFVGSVVAIWDVFWLRSTTSASIEGIGVEDKTSEVEMLAVEVSGDTTWFLLDGPARTGGAIWIALSPRSKPSRGVVCDFDDRTCIPWEICTFVWCWKHISL